MYIIYTSPFSVLWKRFVPRQRESAGCSGADRGAGRGMSKTEGEGRIEWKREGSEGNGVEEESREEIT